MSVSTNQQVKRQGRDGKRGSAPVAAGKRIYEGTYVFLDALGNATDVKVDANTVFAGVACNESDNTGGAAGNVTVEFWTDGNFEVPIVLTDRGDIGAPVHASDNYTATLTSLNNPRIGTLANLASTSVGVVSIHGASEADT